MSFLSDIKPHAISTYSESKILPSVMTAQAVLESGWGESELAENARNLFGIKGMWNGESYTKRTREENAKGQTYYVNAAFRKYPSYRESILDHAAFFTSTPWRTKNYAAVLNAKDYNAQARALQSSGYATDKQYANKLINIIESNGLAAWDKEIGGNSVVKIAVSRGHGKYTAGKRSPNGEREWYFNDKVADAFIAELSKYDVQIINVSDVTGEYDTPLTTRTNSANNHAVDAYIAFHHNALAGRWGSHTGVETWIYQTGGPAQKLANIVNPLAAKAMGLYNRGVKVGNLHEVREPNMCAILIEGGFMDSNIDIVAMRNNNKLAAQGKSVAQGVVQYFGLKAGGNTSASTPGEFPIANKGWSWSGTFIADEEIVVRRGYKSTGAPRLHLNKPVGEDSFIRPGDWINFDHLWFADGFWWVRFKYAAKESSTDFFFMPLGVHNPKVNFQDAAKKGLLWGDVEHLNMNAKTSGVKDWHTKGAVK